MFHLLSVWETHNSNVELRLWFGWIYVFAASDFLEHFEKPSFAEFWSRARALALVCNAFKSICVFYWPQLKLKGNDDDGTGHKSTTKERTLYFISCNWVELLQIIPVYQCHNSNDGRSMKLLRRTIWVMDLICVFLPFRRSISNWSLRVILVHRPIKDLFFFFSLSRLRKPFVFGTRIKHHKNAV